MNAAQWNLLEQAERKLYAGTGGLGYTDVASLGDSDEMDDMLDSMWSHATTCADALISPADLGRWHTLDNLAAERVAKALAVLAFGQPVGSDGQ